MKMSNENINEKCLRDHQTLDNKKILNKEEKNFLIKKNEIDRGHWIGPFDFLISMIAYAVGLGK